MLDKDLLDHLNIKEFVENLGTKNKDTNNKVSQLKEQFNKPLKISN